MGDQLPSSTAASSAAKRPRATAAASRMENVTPSSSSSKRSRRRRRLSAGVSGAREDEDDATIVWRDSPADKQVRVSGTGKCVAPPLCYLLLMHVWRMGGMTWRLLFPQTRSAA